MGTPIGIEETYMIPEKSRKKRRPKKKIVILAAVILVIILVAVNIYRVNNIDVVKVSATAATEEHLVETVPASGTVFTSNRETVLSEVSGTVSDVKVKMGDKVKAGQVLMILDIPDADQRLAAARASLASAEAALYQAGSGNQSTEVAAAQSALVQAESTYNQNKKNLTLMKELFQIDGASQAELDKAQSDYDLSQLTYSKAQEDLKRAQAAAPAKLKSLQANVDSARLQLEAIENQVGRNGLICPRDGQVLSIAVNTGDQITVATQLLTIGNLSTLHIQASVTESEAKKIKVGQAVTFSGNAYPGEKYQGKVVQVGLELINKVTNNQMDTCLPVIISIDSGSMLFPGSNVDLEITTADRTALVVPVEALIDADGGDSVYIIKDSVAHLTAVETGISNGLTMEIKSGVSKGEQVILSPSDQLKDGSRVRVK
ncbi:efflux RND transporter periplasmic adaptor subunit [Dehalobacter sp. DCM]|uniref:efflux RND transporter periplasmic adaptor subunit n=1 Tax=Dehalobacter sp. DCM TaxID=2907827 RepID=UPI0030815FB9|nr:efflux RND transporter periplasmic adaptor subunit [Dehalobacter sp. DCM]